jgi:hypothetical protein
MSEFDRDIKVGDIIRSYHKGYHRVVKVEQRFLTEMEIHHGHKGTLGEEWSSLIHYVQVAKDDGDKVTTKKPVKQSDAGWCHLAKDYLNDHITKLTQLKLDLGL